MKDILLIYGIYMIKHDVVRQDRCRGELSFAILLVQCISGGFFAYAKPYFGMLLGHQLSFDVSTAPPSSVAAIEHMEILMNNMMHILTYQLARVVLPSCADSGLIGEVASIALTALSRACRRLASRVSMALRQV